MIQVYLGPWLYIILHYDDSNLLTQQTSNFWDGDYTNTSEEDPHVVRNYNYDNQNRLISIGESEL